MLSLDKNEFFAIRTEDGFFSKKARSKGFNLLYYNTIGRQKPDREKLLRRKKDFFTDDVNEIKFFRNPNSMFKFIFDLLSFYDGGISITKFNQTLKADQKNGKQYFTIQDTSSGKYVSKHFLNNCVYFSYHFNLEQCPMIVESIQKNKEKVYSGLFSIDSVEDPRVLKTTKEDTINAHYKELKVAFKDENIEIVSFRLIEEFENLGDVELEVTEELVKKISRSSFARSILVINLNITDLLKHKQYGNEKFFELYLRLRDETS